MKSLSEYLIYEKLKLDKNIKISFKNYIQASKKIYKAFGFVEDDEDKFMEVIKNWVSDNDVSEVSFFVNNLNDLIDLGMPKSIRSLYSDDKDTLNKIDASLKKNETEFIKDGNSSLTSITLSGNDFVLSFNGFEISLYVIKIN